MNVLICIKDDKINEVIDEESGESLFFEVVYNNDYLEVQE